MEGIIIFVVVVVVVEVVAWKIAERKSVNWGIICFALSVSATNVPLGMLTWILSAAAVSSLLIALIYYLRDD